MIEETFYFTSNSLLTENDGKIIATLLAFSLSAFITVTEITIMDFYTTWIGNSYEYVLEMKIQGKITIKIDMKALYKLVQRIPTLQWTIRIGSFHGGAMDIQSLVVTKVNRDSVLWISVINNFTLAEQMETLRISPKFGQQIIQSSSCQHQALECLISENLNITVESVKCIEFLEAEQLSSVAPSVFNVVQTFLIYIGLSFYHFPS